jgi:hypothetical protein
VCFYGGVAHVYAARLIVEDRSSRKSGDPIAVVKLLAGWAGVEPTWGNSQAVGARTGAAVRTELLEDAAGSPIWRLTYQLDDAANDGTHWTVSATVIAASSAEAVIVLDRSRVGEAFVRPAKPKPPGCIPALIDAPDLCCTDAGRMLSTSVWVVDEEDAQQLVDLLMSPDRRLPVVAFTARDDDVFDGGLLLEDLVGIAHVVFIGSDTSWRLDSMLPKGLNVYGGAVRLWWPQLQASSRRWDHPLWPADVLARNITAAVNEQVVGAALAVAATDERVIAADRRQAERDFAALRQRIAEIEGHEVDLQELDLLVQSYEEEAQAARARAYKAETDRDFWRTQFEDVLGGRVRERLVPTPLLHS